MTAPNPGQLTKYYFSHLVGYYGVSPLIRERSIYLHLPVKFIGLVMASYLSIDNATSTYVELYVTRICTNFISLQATLPAYQVTVILQIISDSTFIRPTNKSATIYATQRSRMIHRAAIIKQLRMNERLGRRDAFINRGYHFKCAKKRIMAPLRTGLTHPCLSREGHF